MDQASPIISNYISFYLKGSAPTGYKKFRVFQNIDHCSIISAHIFQVQVVELLIEIFKFYKIEQIF